MEREHCGETAIVGADRTARRGVILREGRNIP
jgi:hypothetical protein